MSALLSVEGLSKSYGGIHAVRSVSFTLNAGEILALIGPNGAGKSTCFDMLNGQITPDKGTIRLLGEDTTGLKPRTVMLANVAVIWKVRPTPSRHTARGFRPVVS